MNCTNEEFLSLGKEALDKGETLRIAPIGGSMYPFIRSGDAVRIVSTAGRAPKYADIVLCVGESGRPLIHRITGRRKLPGGTGFVVKGDAANSPDGVIREKDVIGKVVAIEKGGDVRPVDKGIFRVASIVYTALLPVSRWGYALWERCAQKTS